MGIQRGVLRGKILLLLLACAFAEIRPALFALIWAVQRVRPEGGIGLGRRWSEWRGPCGLGGSDHVAAFLLRRIQPMGDGIVTTHPMFRSTSL